MLRKMTFATITFPDKTSEINSLLLVESIRAFAGSLSTSRIVMFFPESKKQISQEFESKLSILEVELIPFEMDLDILRFPFTAHAHAAALAESMFFEKSEVLAWLANNTIILKEPREFLLPKSIVLGYRPVHHSLLGLKYDESFNGFWNLIYEICHVQKKNIFPMKPHVEDFFIKPYFNAGILITRPENCLLEKWRQTFLNSYTNDTFKEYYREDNRYAIFIHQAILSGVILSMFNKNELLELPSLYNYPIHLYNKDITKERPQSIDDCISLRHEEFYKDTDWMLKIPVNDSLKHWLHEHLLQN
jgi:hypothetical protein